MHLRLSVDHHEPVMGQRSTTEWRLREHGSTFDLMHATRTEVIELSDFQLSESQTANERHASPLSQTEMLELQKLQQRN